MPRGVKKENLPHKICVVCNRPFNWRKKWERCWDEVTTCSKSCNRKRRERKNATRREMKSYDCDEDDTQIMSSNDVQYIDKEEKTTTMEREPSGFTNENSLESFEVSALEKHEATSEADESKNGKNKDDIEELDEKFFGALFEDSLSIASENNENSADENVELDPVARRKAERKAMKKARKAERRAKREGRGDPTAGQKQCDMCSKSVDMLIRCTYDESLQWKMVCGKCWKKASGGVVDGDSQHPYYRYGGLWKNRRRK